MVFNSSSENDGKPPSLSTDEIDKLLSITLIANLATLGEDDTIHIIPMWLIRIGNDICIPTSRHTRKYKNLRARPYASVLIDISRAGLNLKGVLIKGPVELVEGEETRRINHQIHLKYVTQDTFFVNKYARLLDRTIHEGYRSNDPEIPAKSFTNTIDSNEEKVFIKEKHFGVPLSDNCPASPLYVWLLSVHSYQPYE